MGGRKRENGLAGWLCIDEGTHPALDWGFFVFFIVGTYTCPPLRTHLHIHLAGIECISSTCIRAQTTITSGCGLHIHQHPPIHRSHISIPTFQDTGDYILDIVEYATSLGGPIPSIPSADIASHPTRYQTIRGRRGGRREGELITFPKGQTNSYITPHQTTPQHASLGVLCLA